MKKNAHIIGLSIFSIVALVFIFGLPHGSATESAETLRQQALELRNKARREDCQKIATRITSCYGGDNGACLKLHESNAWFTNEYQESPELSCPQKELPFGGADGK